MRIALDAMGGDFAPGINITGAIEALLHDPLLEIQLVGQRELLDKQLTESGYSGERLTIVHSADFIGMDEKPMEALRKKPDCSMNIPPITSIALRRRSGDYTRRCRVPS